MSNTEDKDMTQRPSDVFLAHFRTLFEKEGVMIAIDFCRTQYKDNDRSHRENRWELIAELCDFTQKLKHNPVDAETFLQSEFWHEKAHKPKNENVARLAAMYMVGTVKSEGPKYEMARTYGVLVQLLLDKGISPERVFDFIKKSRGIKKATKLLSSEIQMNNVGAKTDMSKLHVSKTKFDLVKPSAIRLDEYELSTVKTEKIRNRSKEAPKPSHLQIVLDAGDLFKEVLDQPIGRPFRLLCKRLKDDSDGYRRIKVQNVRQSSKRLKGETRSA
ncbi:hypothetical protein [Lichenifustis flavocetrariae]|uniref:Uncharacterized protein n=1 Tax=Lichenifustis flavocetrariae TaxID=2949735 RepID=A0AA42CNS9_9HYPH|nr:hypothetical protein [Lichenifustis flavocetrariae]MCW6513126.1 hypothetical protein [Lichenifustis flavocetrariae]